MADDSWKFIKYQGGACLLSVCTAHENFSTPPLQIAPIKVPDKGPLSSLHIFPHVKEQLETSS